MNRAKVRCEVITMTTWNIEYTFRPVVSGSPENEAFFKTTPSGVITLGVKNDKVNFEIGKSYYVDFSEAD